MSIKNEMKKGVLITFIARYSNIIIQLIIGAVLARLLLPEEFGVVAIIMVFITFFNLLADMGIGPAIIQHKDLSKEDNNVIFNFTIILGILLAGGFYLISFFIAEFYSNIEYITIGKYLTLSVFFFSLNIVPQALLRKEKRFKLIGIIQIISNIVIGIITIYLAYTGFSYYSLVVQAIMRSFIMFILFYNYSGLRFQLSLSLIPIKKIIGFSTYQFLFNFINYFSRNLDTILVGKFLGSSALGLYDRAYKLMLYPVQNLTHVITPVLHPVLSNYQNEKEVIYQTYKKLLKILAILGVPTSVILYFAADEIILLLYGNQWEGSIPIFKILSISVMIQIILSSSGSIFQSTGRTDLLFLSGSLSAVFTITGIGAGVFLKGTIEWVGIGILIAFIANIVQCYWLMYKYIFKKRFLEFLKILINPLIIGSVMTIGFILLKVEFSNIYLSLGYKVFLGFIIFLLSAKLINDPTYEYVISLIKSKVNRKNSERKC